MANTQRNFVLGRMNKSLDERLLPNGEYVDAVNLRLGSTEESEVGSVENAKGNTQLSQLYFIDPVTLTNTPLSSEARTIGVYEDGANETLYWFVHDPKCPIGDTGKLDMIVSLNILTGFLKYHITSIDDGSGINTTLNFNPQFLITATNKVSDLLFFTDFLNPPRFINIKNSYGEPIVSTVTTGTTTAFVFTAGSVTQAGIISTGFHQGTVLGCPTPTNAIGAGAAPTTTQIALPGTGCYSSTVVVFGVPGPLVNVPLTSKGFGIQGANTASGFALTHFVTNSNGTATFGLIMSSGGGNPGTGIMRGEITGSDGSTGKFVGQYAPTAQFVDESNATQNPESLGGLSLTSITLVDGVTYTLKI